MGMRWLEGLGSRGRAARLALKLRGRGWRTRFLNCQARSRLRHPTHPLEKRSGILGSKGPVGCTRPRR
eukprot:4589381-Pyramimonas_sp.AAC.1